MSNQSPAKEHQFHYSLQRNEICTMHYLGLPYLVLARTPQLVLKVPLSTMDYLDGNKLGYAVQIVFTCPPNYPMERPHVEIVEMRNVPDELEMAMRREINTIMEQHMGLQMMVPVVTYLQMLLNNENKRLVNRH